MDEYTIKEQLMDICSDEFEDDVQSIFAIEDSGYCTHDVGFVMQTKDGMEFAVTIHQWR